MRGGADGKLYHSLILSLSKDEGSSGLDGRAIKATARKIASDGAMAARNSRQRNLLLSCFLLLAALATLVLNLPRLFFEPLLPWVRIAVPAALAAGLAGSVMPSRPLRALGWIGLCYFCLLVLATSIPGEDYILGGAGDSDVPRHVSGAYILLRFALMAALSLSLIVCFAKLAKAKSSVGTG